MEEDNKKKTRKYQKSSSIELRDIRITIRLTKAENIEIERNFRDANFSKISDYIRYKMLLGSQLSATKTRQEFYEKLIFEINKIGVNINQVTKVINQNRSKTNSANTDALESSLDKLIEKLEIILKS